MEKTDNFRSVADNDTVSKIMSNKHEIDNLKKDVKIIKQYIKTSVRLEQLLQMS